MDVEKISEKILEKIHTLNQMVGKMSTYEGDMKISEMMKNLAIVYKLLGGGK